MRQFLVHMSNTWTCSELCSSGWLVRAHEWAHRFLPEPRAVFLTLHIDFSWGSTAVPLAVHWLSGSSAVVVDAIDIAGHHSCLFCIHLHSGRPVGLIQQFDVAEKLDLGTLCVCVFVCAYLRACLCMWFFLLLLLLPLFSSVWINGWVRVHVFFSSSASSSTF